ncbi:hypothetical protein PINS_up005222 [Pythium insidiosum]|nr:hypothetical protein PINS_up005222 [Pythium insidiosum]
MHSRSEEVKRRLVDAGFPLLPSVSHIVPLMVGDAVKVKEAVPYAHGEAQHLRPAINFPTVPSW